MNNFQEAILFLNLFMSTTEEIKVWETCMSRLMLSPTWHLWKDKSTINLLHPINSITHIM